MIGSEEEARAFVAQRCDAEAVARLERLVELLAAANNDQNLVAKDTLNIVWQRHIADSAQLLDHVSRETPRWIDLGSGAGFPGLVVAMMRPDWPVTLVESRALRIAWLEQVIGDMRLPNCTVVGCRLEDMATETFDIISARAFAPLPKLLRLARRFSTSDTQWLLPKGRSAAQEVAQLPRELCNAFHVEQSVTHSDSGIVIGRLSQGIRA